MNTVTYTSSGGIARITIDKPASRNSLSLETLRELQVAFEHAESDAGTRVVILAGNGPAFCAGHDLKEIRAHAQTRDYAKTLFDACAKLMLTITQLSKPVIARVQGIATAAGAQLVATADLAIAADNARFGTPGVNIGLFCSTPMVALSRNLSRKHALEMLLLGELIPAEDALRFGLVNRLVPEADLDAAVNEIAQKIASKSFVAVKTGKRAFYKQLELGLEDAYAYTAKVMEENLQSADACEGICAFIEKRVPVWTNEENKNNE
ncbi:MAG: enoyl-CoA hydratase [Opitutales bacterium]|nr:enoyl-CoA hydratase [Opitutales bacterium]